MDYKYKNLATMIIIMAIIMMIGVSPSCKDKETDEGIVTPTDTLITYTSIRHGSSTLSFKETKDKTYFPCLQLDKSESYYQQMSPLIAEVFTSSASYEARSVYQTINVTSENITCGGTLVTKNGSKILFQDVYKKADNGLFEINRTVTVQDVNASDIGFSTQLSFKKDKKSFLHNYDFFVPGVWYKDNAYVASGALASSSSDNEFWIREDRLPLPFIMLRDKNTGETFSIVHKDPDGSTFKGEEGLQNIIDARLKFASVGLQNNQHPSVGIIYPGSEGERTYISGSQKKWAYRSHPMKKGFEQNYKVAFRLNNESSYTDALKNTWGVYYQLFSPSIYACDLNKVYDIQISVLDKYWKSINGAAGLPFAVLLNGQMDKESDYNFNMGFVGHQPGNAFILIREGLKKNNQNILSKGEQMADFWATQAMTESGCPKTWYDPYPQTWRGPEVALREIGDGMIELLRAWNYEKKYGKDKPTWLASCVKVADWIVSTQLENGSFYSHFNYNTGKQTKEYTNCTSHIIPYLVEMYMATNNAEYKDAVIKAGNFIYTDIMEDFRYVGGAIDNPNVMDKEAASMALRAFLALYDLNNSKSWMDAVMQTVYFYQSWVVCWNIPIPTDDGKAVFPAKRSVVGQSLIATGHSAVDTYAAIDALGFYRAYLYSGDEQLLHFSKLLFHNTKQFMNWNPEGDPIAWIAPGLFGEAMNICVPRGHGVNFYLPWATYNQLEPLVLMEDIFGHMDITQVQNLSEAERKKKHAVYSQNRLYKN